MGTVTGDKLVGQVQTLLHDDGTRWPPEELLGWLNAGQREVVGINPAANVVTDSVQLSKGTRQKLPEGANRLMDLTRNMGSDGESPGRAVSAVSRKSLDSHNPRWHQSDAVPEVRHYMFDARDPAGFFVYPPSKGERYVEVLYSVDPRPLDDVGDTIALDDLYANALVDYVMYRATLKDSEFAAAEDASSYYAAFQQFVSHRAAVDGMAPPKTSEGGG